MVNLVHCELSCTLFPSETNESECCVLTLLMGFSSFIMKNPYREDEFCFCHPAAEAQLHASAALKPTISVTG